MAHPIAFSFVKKFSLVIITLCILLSAWGLAPRAHASQPTSNDLSSLLQTLLKQVTDLQEQLKGVSVISKIIQGEAPEHTYSVTDDGKTGRSSITLKQPAQKSIFNKQNSRNPLVVKWDAKNIPKNSVVEVELEALKLTGGSVGGGIWQGEIPAGDSTGTYSWTIYGEGRADAGKYRVRTSVRACHSDGCDVNPRFPGLEERIKTYGKSAWSPITIVDGKTNTLRTFKAVLNGKTVDSELRVTKDEAEELCSDVYNDYDTYNFQGGDVLKCYWEGTKFLTQDEWKG